MLASDVEVGALAFIGKLVRIGSGTIVQHHATIEGNTEIGSGNNIFPYAFIGARTQDLKYTGGEPCLKIGDRNTYREFSTNRMPIVGSYRLFTGAACAGACHSRQRYVFGRRAISGSVCRAGAGR